MFGNMTKRLAGSLAVATVSNVGHVVVPSSAEFHSGLFRHGVHGFGATGRLWFCSTGEERVNPITVLHKAELLQGPGGHHDYDEELELQVWEDLHNIVIPQATFPTLAPDHLVIHLRGGDVFGPRKPASYGQPPLSFYTLILESEEWSAVTIVHEDSVNPVLPGILEAAAQRKIPVFQQSGSVYDDVAVLLTARRLVAGRGTFVPAIAGLSRAVERVYYFENKFSVFPARHDVEIVRVADANGDYVRNVLSHNWSNSPEQRALMLDYPVSSLVIES